MNLKKLCLLAILASSSMVFATIDLRTTINPVYIDGSCEQTGIIQFVVSADDFKDASTLQPVYIRITLEKAARLCKTLVLSNESNVNGGALVASPIYLPIQFDGNSPAVITAVPETVSIVRWVQGESAFWLKVQSPTVSWTNFGAPDNDTKVKWTVGISARTSWEQNKSEFDAGRANLPSSTRDVVGLTTDEAVSTLICVDLRNSNLEAAPLPDNVSLLGFDPISYDFTTTGVDWDGGVNFAVNSEANIINGSLTFPSFSGDTEIGRGYDFICTVNIPKGGTSPVAAALCLVPGSSTQQGTVAEDGLVCMTNTVLVDVNCAAGWGFHENSRVRLATESGTEYGFEVEFAGGSPVEYATGLYQLRSNALDFIGASNSQPYGSIAGSIITPGGHYLTRDAEIQYAEPEGVPGDIRLTISATVCQWYQEDPVDVNLNIAVYASNRDRNDIIDLPPFQGIGSLTDGTDQERACDASLRKAGEVEWFFGRFVECRSSSCVRIFFQYMPRFVDTDGGDVDFFTGVSYVNQGVAPLNSVVAHIYESDGSYWTAELPELPVRNQHTWLFAYDADLGSVAFTDNLGGMDPVIPVSQDGDLVFGDNRSSMFIEGCFAADDDRSGDLAVDLDGYLIIGNGNENIGAYTARNFEISAYNRNPNQDGDLPTLYTKTREYNKLMKEFAPNFQNNK